MNWLGRSSRSTVLAAVLSGIGGCAAPGEALNAADFCERLAVQVCEAQERCCRRPQPMSDASVQDAVSLRDASDVVSDGRSADVPSAVDVRSVRDGGADAGDAGDGGEVMDVYVPPPSCERVQRDACERVLGVMVRDTRLGYVATRGAALVAAVRSAAERCEALPGPSQVRALFAGTGAERSNCSPSASTLSALATAQASCQEDTTCRLSLRSDAVLLGVCERRMGNDDTCSHPLDCAAAQYCELASDWQPSQWGHCQTPRANGWECTDDLRCESGYCGVDGKCATRPASGFCLNRSYSELILAERPEAYVAFDNEPTDGTGHGNTATLNGMTSYTPSGALADNTGAALTLNGMNAWAAVPLAAMPVGNSGISVELWLKLPNTMGRGPVVQFFSMSDGPGFSLAYEGTTITADFASITGTSRRITSDADALAADRWTHVVATWDGALGRLFLNGTQTAQITASALDLRGELRVGYAAAVMMGAMPSYLRGSVDELAVYRRALSPTAVAQHYAAAVQGSVSVASSVYRWLE